MFASVSGSEFLISGLIGFNYTGYIVIRFRLKGACRDGRHLLYFKKQVKILMAHTAMWFSTHKKSGTKQIIASHKKDGWEGSGNFADLYEVNNFIVLVSPLSQKPFLVTETYDSLQEIIKEKYGFNILEEKPKNAF